MLDVVFWLRLAQDTQVAGLHGMILLIPRIMYINSDHVYRMEEACGLVLNRPLFISGCGI